MTYPEGRQPLSLSQFQGPHYDSQGRRILHSHPSTWEAECEQLRAQNGELALQVLASDGQAAEAHTAQLKAQEETRWQMIRAQQAIDEAKALRERVAQLEAALERFVAHYPNGINPMLDDAEIEARAALEAKL